MLALAAFAAPANAAAQDGGVRDAGARDAGARDGGVRGAGVRDAGAPDAAPLDASAPDAGARDAAPADTNVIIPAQDASAEDSGAQDGSLSDATPAGPPVPMLAIGPTQLLPEVFATTVDPARAVATAERVPLVTAGEVAAEINRRAPALRAAFVDPARVDELAHSLVRDRVLAEAARRAGLMDDVEVKREVERTLGRILLERAFAADPAPASDEATARAFYQAHLADYTKPEQVRVLAIVLGSREDAVRALAEASGLADRRFGAVARRRTTDQVSRRRDGSLGWLYVGSRPEDGLVEAAVALRVGETTRAPLEFDGRFYILRTVERRAPEPVSFERARASVASRLRAEYRQHLEDVLLARVSREQGVVVRPVASAVRVGP